MKECCKIYVLRGYNRHFWPIMQFLLIDTDGSFSVWYYTVLYTCFYTDHNIYALNLLTQLKMLTHFILYLYKIILHDVIQFQAWSMHKHREQLVQRCMCVYYINKNANVWWNMLEKKGEFSSCNASLLYMHHYTITAECVFRLVTWRLWHLCIITFQMLC